MKAAHMPQLVLHITDADLKNGNDLEKAFTNNLLQGGQFSWGISKYHDNCKKYLDMSNVNAQVIQACYDVMYGGKSKPMHNFCSFRSTSETKRQGQEILGNTYFDPWNNKKGNS